MIVDDKSEDSFGSRMMASNCLKKVLHNVNTLFEALAKVK